jgi:glycosyltransferase involved in cell wall biosynthesis
MTEQRPPSPPIHLVVPGPIETLTGGFIYDRRVADGMRQAGRLGGVTCLAGAYPFPGAPDLEKDARSIASLHPDGPLVIDGLALTTLADRLPEAVAPSPLIALVHHALCDETGLSPEMSRKLFEAERAALRRVRGCIVTSPATARRMADFGIASDRIRVVLPGLDHPAPAPPKASRAGQPVRLLCVASLTPRKGQDQLLRALAALTDLDWRLDLVGGARDPDHARRIKAMAAAPDLKGRVCFLGEVESAGLANHYRGADIFVLPSHHEGYGMALAEAMAHGLPVISTHAGAIPETVPRDAGELVPPGNAEALAESLRRLIVDATARKRMGEAARLAAARMPSWERTAADFTAAVDGLSGWS